MGGLGSYNSDDWHSDLIKTFGSNLIEKVAFSFDLLGKELSIALILASRVRPWNSMYIDLERAAIN